MVHSFVRNRNICCLSLSLSLSHLLGLTATEIALDYGTMQCEETTVAGAFIISKLDSYKLLSTPDSNQKLVKQIDSLIRFPK